MVITYTIIGCISHNKENCLLSVLNNDDTTLVSCADSSDTCRRLSNERYQRETALNLDLTDSLFPNCDFIHTPIPDDGSQYLSRID